MDSNAYFCPKYRIDMRCVMTVTALCLLAMMPVWAQDNSEMEALMAVMGTADLEDADEYEVERLASLLDRPLKINLATASRLVASGLFSSYQAASVLDYRVRHGDILSFMELSVLDGFNEEYVRLIKPFLDLSSGTLPSVGKSGVSNDLRLRSGLRLDGDMPWNYALKYEIESLSGFSAGLSLSRGSTASGHLPDAFSATVEYESRRFPLRLLAGDLNVRFGQGLALWNGMSMSGLSTPSTFMKRSSGFSRSSSFTGNYAMTGVAASMSSGHFAVNASVSFPGIRNARASPEKVTVMPMLNLMWNHRHGQIGITHYLDLMSEVKDMKSSVDMAWCIRGTDVFAELAYDWKGRVPAGLAGVSFPVGESFRGAAMLRAYPPAYNSEKSGAQKSTSKCSNEYSITLAGEYLSPDRSHSASLSADMAHFPEPKSKTAENDRQLKLLAVWNWTSEKISLKVRLGERVRSWGLGTRTDFRTDMSLPLDGFVFNARVNMLYSKSLAGLCYAEGGYKAEELTVYLRTGVFVVDNWDDRIYVYERDAPGGFNVPAMYGRGVWTAATVSWKPVKWLKLYARASLTAYPLMKGEKKKPGRAELKLQSVFSF